MDRKPDTPVSALPQRGEDDSGAELIGAVAEEHDLLIERNRPEAGVELVARDRSRHGSLTRRDGRAGADSQRFVRDLLRGSEAALGQVERILRRTDSDVVILRVAHTPAYPYTEFPIVPARPMDEAELYVKQVAGRLSDRGARARGMALEGSPAAAILEAAEQVKATLIAMATHGRTGLARWVFGSVTEKVLRSSPVPLLVLRSFERGVRTSEAPIAIPKILVPIERFHLGIVPCVKDVAQLFGSRVLFLHVVEPGEDPAARTKAQAEAESAGRELIDAGIPAVILERTGKEPAEEILRVADEEGVGLIAITTHGRRGPTRWALGSVTEKVLRSATLPLLVVRHPR